ncbi:ER membrane protein complex subunit 6 isoform X2 [Mauremys reevesii]|uniref:ER membrane protein complex subunit 6 isoform X2 n=1 Tax=Mauremys reevesii TaxID=260615 RepID=UPI00193FA130|nr:ER membrane protein complex subunit 6 isoform X2 [Mauremys reevesii]
MSLGRPRPGRAGKLQLGSRLLDQSFIICVLVAFYLRNCVLEVLSDGRWCSRVTQSAILSWLNSSGPENGSTGSKSAVTERTWPLLHPSQAYINLALKPPFNIAALGLELIFIFLSERKRHPGLLVVAIDSIWHHYGWRVRRPFAA